MRYIAFAFFLLAFSCQGALAQSAPFEIRRPYGTVPQPPERTQAGPASVAYVWPPEGWSPTSFHGYSRALQAGKPLIVLVQEKNCLWCSRLEGVLLSDPRFVQMQSRAVFALSELATDDEKGNNRKLMADLQVDRFPTLLLLEVRSNEIKELTRIVGFFPADQIIGRLESFMK